mmetsp:Transcript_46038/g.147206  ORF Transcript_46038/g.147206 Transcript_46038/m.147206 type:complete len:95 (-) Transcript_46038:125-409(-)
MGILKQGFKATASVITTAPTHLLVATKWDVRRKLTAAALERLEELAMAIYTKDSDPIAQSLEETMEWDKYKKNITDTIAIERVKRREAENNTFR